MMNAVSPELTSVRESNDAPASHQLLPLVYKDLRRVAARRRATQPPGQTLQPTALVHEAFMRLGDRNNAPWVDQQHFVAAASEAMRHILIDRARRKAAVRHGGGQQAVTLEEEIVDAQETNDRVSALEEALQQLEAHDGQAAQLVRLHFFAGCTFAEAALRLNISERTAKRVWSYARAWLYEAMERSSGRA